MKFDEDDNPGGGYDTEENELIVASGGSLLVEGEDGSPVTFEGTSPSEGAWYGINVESGGAADIEYADIRDATFGVLYRSAEEGCIKYSSFEGNESADIVAGTGDGTLDLVIEGNYITIGGGQGINLTSAERGILVKSNHLAGNGYTSAGIYRVFATEASLLIESNTISGVYNGAAIQVGTAAADTIRGNTLGNMNKQGVLVQLGYPVIIGNTITYCTTGIEVSGGTPVIGWDEEGAGNTITHCNIGMALSSTATPGPILQRNTISNYLSNGIKVTDGVPVIGIQDEVSSGNLITLGPTGLNVRYDGAPVVRCNRFVENQYGVIAAQGGDADLGTSDPNALGKNSFLDNYYNCIWNANQFAIYAEGNYFGECSGGVPEDCTVGNVEIGNAYCQEPSGVVVDIVEALEEPGELRALGARPNPLRGVGQLYFSLAGGGGQVEVQVFDVAGRLVRSFGAFEAVPGENHVRWDGTGNDGVPVGSGMYFVRVITDNKLHDTAKLLVVR